MRFTFDTKFLALSLWMAVIFFLSHQNGHDSSETSGILLELLKLLGIGPGSSVQGVLSYLVRKAGHFTEYLILAILFLRTRKGRGSPVAELPQLLQQPTPIPSRHQMHQSYDMSVDSNSHRAGSASKK